MKMSERDIVDVLLTGYFSNKLIAKWVVRGDDGKLLFTAEDPDSLAKCRKWAEMHPDLQPASSVFLDFQNVTRAGKGDRWDVYHKDCGEFIAPGGWGEEGLNEAIDATADGTYSNVCQKCDRYIDFDFMIKRTDRTP